MNRSATLGILGGGQLARMTAFETYRLGFNLAILEKEKASPAGALTDKEFVGWVDDKELLKKFADTCDVVSLENEFIDYNDLLFIEELGKKVIPSSKTISLIQDKLIQKETLKKNGIPVPKFIPVENENSFERIKEALGAPFILKSRKMGYDGYGNAFVQEEKEFIAAYKKLTRRHSELYAEELIDFKKELAIMVVRTKKEIKTYPVVETIQKDHICHTVIAPAQISAKGIKEAEEIGIECVKAVEGFGIFGIETFIDAEDNILVNEMAPRPHNSGHYTIEACYTSQFENHARAALDLPLGDTSMVKPYAVMVNLLGKKEGIGTVENYPEALSDPRLHLHIYGKAKSRLGRKMGHITMIGDDLEEIIKLTKTYEEKIII